jgi:hypothetical protein
MFRTWQADDTSGGVPLLARGVHAHYPLVVVREGGQVNPAQAPHSWSNKKNIIFKMTPKNAVPEGVWITRVKEMTLAVLLDFCCTLLATFNEDDISPFHLEIFFGRNRIVDQR